MALPGDNSPSSAPGDPDQKGLAGQVEEARPEGASRAEDPAGQSDQEPGRLPGLPKLFFAAEDLQEQHESGEPSAGEPSAGQPSAGQPSAGQPSAGQPGAGQPGAGQENGWSQPADPAQLVGTGEPGQPGDSARPTGFEPRNSLGQPPRPRFGQRRPAGPARQPPAGPPRSRPSRQPDRELRHRALASLVLSVLALVALLGLGGDLHRGVYLLIFSAVVGIGSCIIGITAVVKARKTGCYRPRGSIAGIVLGALTALLSIWILSIFLAFPHQVDNYIKCVNQNPSGTSQHCMHKFYKSLHPGALGHDGGVIVQMKARSGQG
ncbi:MAG: hypothetical protein ACTHJW_17025 [Streptosporangiaceae bacterium]